MINGALHYAGPIIDNVLDYAGPFFDRRII